MKRREFMISAATATGLSSLRTASAQSNDAKRSRVAIMMFGLNSIVSNNMPPSPARTVDIMDIGQLCADRFGVHQVELQSNYFPSTEMSWLRDFKARLARTKTRIVQINLEFGAGYNMGADAPSGRLQMLDLHRVWFDKLAFLECPRALLNQGVPSDENKAQILANFRAVSAIAKEKKIIPSSENRNAPGAGRAAGAATSAGGQTPPAQPATPAPPPPPAGPPMYLTLTEILNASGTAACVDFLNFPNQPEQLAGIKAMLPTNSGLVHAGMRFDLAPAMKVCREAGYKGLYSLKASGLQGDPIENTSKILEGVLAEM
jgi:hypothetical protein